jgi:uncharacterized phage protein (TIGR01671 family)
MTMREILFRGKDVDRKEWVYGGYSLYPHTHFPATPTIYEMDRSCWRPVDVDPATVGQYTGLTDKNGKKIFEGDIVRHYNDERMPEAYDIGCIIFNTCECMFRRTAAGRNDTFAIARHCLYEVIGNIHDNPGLMGGAENVCHP